MWANMSEQSDWERDNMQEEDRDVERECYEAATYIGYNLRKWGRCNTTWKSKYNTCRVYNSFGMYEVLHGLIYPGYSYFQWPKWVVIFDLWISKYFRRPVNFVVVPYQKWLYRWLYKRANKKWPLLGERLLCHADWEELLVGIPISPDAKKIMDRDNAEKEIMP
jgi:hypothetical protein